MRESIYGPENRIVSAQMGMGYSMPMWLPPQERVGFASVRKAYWGEPTVKYHTGSSQIILYPYGRGYHNTVTWGVYNSKGVLVSTQFGTWDSEPVYVPGSGYLVKYTWNNFPSSGMSAAWVTTTGQATIPYQEEAMVRRSLGQYISPTYQEILAADREEGLSGTSGVLQSSSGATIGTLYEDFWTNDLNGSYSRYYRHYQMTDPPTWGGDTGVVYYNTDKGDRDYSVNTIGFHRMASEIPYGLITGDSYPLNGEIFNFYTYGGTLNFSNPTTANIDRGDGVRLTHLRGSNSRYVSGDEGLETDVLTGTYTASDSGYPSTLLPGATLARLSFSNYYVYIPSVGESNRLRLQNGVLNGTYVEGYEDTLTFTPLERHEVAYRQCKPASLVGLQGMYAYCREERVRATARLQSLMADKFRTRLAEYLGGSERVGVVDTKVIKRSAKKSKWAYRDPVLSVSIQDSSGGEGITRREVHLSYPVVENGETVLREGVLVGTLEQRPETLGEQGGSSTMHVFDNYYFDAGVPVSVDNAETSSAREPDYVATATSRYPGRIATGLCTITGSSRTVSALESTLRLAEAYSASDHDLQNRIGRLAVYNFPSEPAQVRTEVPPFIQQYLDEVPIKYAEGAGTPKWVETAAHHGQRITLTWFGPKGKGAFALWEDRDSELEVYGQLVCRYDEEQNDLTILQWAEVKKPNHSFLVPNVRRRVVTENGVVDTVEDVHLPTATAPRLAGMWKSLPYADLFGAGSPNYNCIVSFSGVKPPDVKQEVLAQKEASEGIVLLEDYVLSVFNGL